VGTPEIFEILLDTLIVCSAGMPYSGTDSCLDILHVVHQGRGGVKAPAWSGLRTAPRG
jgi:hypothetical protein